MISKRSNVNKTDPIDNFRPTTMLGPLRSALRLNATNALAIVLGLTILLLAPISLMAQTDAVPQTPRGWTKTRVKGKHPHTCFTLDAAKSPDYLVVKFYQRERLIDDTLESWLYERLTGNAPLGGKWTGPTKNMTRQTGNIYTAEREFEFKGTDHAIRASAICVDKLNVRMAATIYSKTDTFRKNDSAAEKLRYELIHLEIAAAKSSKRGLNIETNPPKVKGLKAGGTIKPGLYIGTSVSKRDNKIGSRFELFIFPNGEYELPIQHSTGWGSIVSMAIG